MRDWILSCRSRIAATSAMFFNWLSFRIYIGGFLLKTVGFAWPFLVRQLQCCNLPLLVQSFKLAEFLYRRYVLRINDDVKAFPEWSPLQNISFQMFDFSLGNTCQSKSRISSHLCSVWCSCSRNVAAFFCSRSCLVAAAYFQFLLGARCSSPLLLRPCMQIRYRAVHPLCLLRFDTHY